MKKRYCDICGNEIIEEYASSIPAVMFPPIGNPVSGEIDFPGYYTGSHHYDLCKWCAYKIYRVIEKFKEEIRKVVH